jgi:hypothetical protein
MVMVFFPFTGVESGLESDGRAISGHRDPGKFDCAGRHSMWASAAGSIEFLPHDQMAAVLLARLDVVGEVKERSNRFA